MLIIVTKLVMCADMHLISAETVHKRFKRNEISRNKNVVSGLKIYEITRQKMG